MLEYEFIATDPATGRKVKSTVSADSSSAAARLISEQGFAPIEIKLKQEKKKFFRGRNSVKAKEKVLFSRQLATLINAGLPLTQSLRTVAEQMPNEKFVLIINRIISDVEGGSALAKAMAKHANVFNQVYISLVAAGETSGTLDKALERLADQQEKDAEITSKVRGALIYPVIVLVVIFAVVGFMLVTVLPQVEQLYLDLGQQLPFVTRIILIIANFLINFWWLVALMLVGAAWGLRQYSKTPSGKSKFDKLKMRAPLVGKLFHKLYMARFTRTGETLMASGVPMLEMMKISADAVNNVHIAASLDRAQAKVKAGVALSEAISNDPNFLSLVPQMIHVGEQSGSIDAMMGRAATYFENELDRQIKALSTIIEPLLMVVLAFVAGIVVVAILLPIYGLIGSNLGL